MSYLSALIFVLTLHFIAWAVKRLLPAFLSGAGVWYLIRGDSSVTGAILLLSGLIGFYLPDITKRRVSRNELTKTEGEGF